MVKSCELFMFQFGGPPVCFSVVTEKDIDSAHGLELGVRVTADQGELLVVEIQLLLGQGPGQVPIHLQQM